MTAEIANFCYQSDEEGKISRKQAKQIYEKIKNYNDNKVYGYAGRPNPTTFADLKNLFEDCVVNGKKVRWV